MLKAKYKSRLSYAQKPKTQQQSVSVKVKNQTDTKFKFLNDIISQRLEQKATKRTNNLNEERDKSTATTTVGIKTENTAATKQQFDNMKAKSINSTKLVTTKSPAQQTKQNAVPTLAACVKVNEQLKHKNKR